MVPLFDKHEAFFSVASKAWLHGYIGSSIQSKPVTSRHPYYSTFLWKQPSKACNETVQVSDPIVCPNIFSNLAALRKLCLGVRQWHGCHRKIVSMNTAPVFEMVVHASRLYRKMMPFNHLFLGWKHQPDASSLAWQASLWNMSQLSQ